MKKQLSALLLATAALTTPSFAQDIKLPVLSPKATIQQDFSGSYISVEYSRPSARGREVFRDVVSYGQVWRTGANAATKIKFGEDLLIGGKKVTAGEYSLYTIPGKDQWEVILNTNTGNWGASGYSPATDVARFQVKPEQLDRKVETFTINISDITINTANIEISWDKTKVSIPVKADNADRIHDFIQKGVSRPSIAYNHAANYYLETGTHLDKALEYADKAIEQNPKAFYLYGLKAQIAAKLGKKKEATDAARKSIELGKGTPYEVENTRNQESLINSLK